MKIYLFITVMVMIITAKAVEDDHRPIVKQDFDFDFDSDDIGTYAARGLLLLTAQAFINSIAGEIWMIFYRKNIEANSQIAETELGPIEYRIQGDAPYMLLMPGTPGPHFYTWGMDQNEEGFGIITVSRPGYARTPLSSGATAIETADLIISLLDYLNIDKIAITAVSGSGPTGYNMALKYPERVHCLNTVVAVSGGYMGHSMVDYSDFQFNLFFNWMTGPTTSLLAYYYYKNSPESALIEDAAQTSTWDEEETKSQVAKMLADPTIMEAYNYLFNDWDTFFGFSAYNLAPGMANDIKNHFTEVIPLELIEVPTLIIHSSADGLIDVSQAYQANEKIAGSELIIMENASHNQMLDSAWADIDAQRYKWARDIVDQS